MADRRQVVPRNGIGRDEWIPLIAIAAVSTVMAIWTPGNSLHDDALRFIEIASAHGTPYRDFAVEYPPLETLLILLLGHGSDSAVVLRMVIINAVSTVGCWWLVRTHWTRKVGVYFLWFALPLQVFMPFRVDMLSVALIVAALVLADRHRQTLGGLVAAVSILFRLWPVVVVPVFLLRDQRRAFAVSIAVTLILGLAWIWGYGPDALTQVTGYRGATGWQVESAPGLVTQMLHPSEPFRYEQGAVRVGTMQPWQMRALRLLSVALVAAAWWIGRRRRVDPAGGPALASVAVLLLLSPVFSPQYVVWLLPWAAIVAVERRARDVRILMVGASCFASLAIAVYIGDRDPVELGVFTAGKMICILGLAIVGFTHARVDTELEREVPAPTR